MNSGQPIVEVPVLICSECKKVRTGPNKRLPSGWKRKEEVVFCNDCWSKLYVLRAITVPVASPMDQTWPELRAVLKDMWAATTQACNWIITELYARDVRRTNEEKMPPLPHIYLYPEARPRFPQLPSGSLSTLEQQVKAKYRAKRYEIVWTCASSLPTYRYPTPFPCPNQRWRLSFEYNMNGDQKDLAHGEVPVVIMHLGDRRIRLRLKAGVRYRRQLAALRDIASKRAVQGQMDLYERADDLLCKIVAWLPRDLEQLKKPRSGTLYVQSTADALVVALDAKAEKLWTYNGDQIRRWSAEHRKQLQRWSDDSKAEHRPVVPFQKRREEAARRYRNRMNSACHQIAAMIAGYANRRHFATVEYRDSDKSFCSVFPWFRLRELIQEKCDAYGIDFNIRPYEPHQESSEKSQNTCIEGNTDL